MASAAEQLASSISFASFQKATELKKRLWFTLGALILFRLLSFVPVPGIDPVAMNALYQTQIWYFQGSTAGPIAFTAAVMGGIGNFKGAVLGGLIIGIIQQLSDNRIGTEWTPAIVFGYLVLIMVLRPRGLLGEETREAG